MSDKRFPVGEFRAWASATARRRFRSTIIFIATSTAAQAEALVLTALGGSDLRDAAREARLTGLAVGSLRSDAEHYGALRTLIETRDFGRRDRAIEGQRTRAAGRRGIPHRHQVGSGAQCAGPEKYVVCNADESEPGTIKDRFIMQHLPHLVIEGMIIAGLVTGARRGILYIRHEYEAQEQILEEEIRALLRQKASRARASSARV